MGTPRLKYNNINVDFDRRPNLWRPDIESDFSDNQSAYGVNERLTFFKRWRIAMGKRMLTAAEAWRLWKFFDYVRDGSSFELWYDAEFGDYVPFDGKSLTTVNEKSQSTFTRTGTTGYYVDSDRASSGIGSDTDSGLVMQAVENEPRYEAGKFGRGILLEFGSTNSLIYSSDFSNAAWVKTTTTVATDVATVDDPAGTNTADQLTFGASGGTVVQTSAYTPPSATTPITGSVWVMCDDGLRTIYLDLIDNAGATRATATILAAPTWARYSVMANTGWNTGGPAKFQIRRTTSATTVYAWLAQLEGSREAATAIIPTVATTQTRNSDRLEYTASDFFDEWTRKFTVSFWIKRQSQAASVGRIMVWVDSSVAAGRMMSIAITTSNTWEFRVYKPDNSIVAISAAVSASGLTTSWHHVVAVCDSTASNGLSLYLDGASIDSSTSDAFIPAPLSAAAKIGIGAQTGTGGISFHGTYDDFAVWKRAFTAAEVLALYNSNKPVGARRNYWSALRLRDSEFAPELIEGGNRYNWQATFEEVLT